MLYEKDGKMLETIQRFIFQIIVLSDKNPTTYFFSSIKVEIIW